MDSKVSKRSLARWQFLVGNKYGKLVVLEIACKDKNFTYARCLCDCGRECFVACTKLQSGHTKSCGCLNNFTVQSHNKGRKLKSHVTKHGQAVGEKTKLYKIWQGINARCYNPNNNYYHIYGGRGITVCDEWRNDFTKFMEWSYNHGYNENEHYASGKNKLTIDRIDNNKGYSPDNCRWTTWSVQNSNKRKTKDKNLSQAESSEQLNTMY